MPWKINRFLNIPIDISTHFHLKIHFFAIDHRNMWEMQVSNKLSKKEEEETSFAKTRYSFLWWKIFSQNAPT